MNVDQVITFARKESVENIDLKFTNLFGGIHHITMPLNMLTESLFKRGVGIDGSSIPGFKIEGASDMVLIPDPETATIDPFWQRRTLSMLGSVYSSDTHEPYPLDPRQIIRHAEEYLKTTGVADRSMWGPEFEFNIFDSISYRNRENTAFYRLESKEAGWSDVDVQETDYRNLIQSQRGYHAAPPNDKYFLIRDRMSATIEQFGIPVKYHHHEVGRAGQSEIETAMLSAVDAGDAAVNIKYILRNVAHQEGCCVTFMAKPTYGEAGNGMHFHQNLFNGSSPTFYDKKGYGGLSETALHYIGGLLIHGRALLALTNPSTNSYKRLLPGFEAPVNAIFGLGNRSCAIRIPKYATEPDKKRIEFRPPDGTCNVYLAIAAQLMAGIDGIKNKIDPTAEGFGPYDHDVTKLPAEEQANIPRLPSSLTEAIEALKADHDFLLAGDVFSTDFLNNWIEKLRNDVSEINNRPHPFEMQLYFDS